MRVTQQTLQDHWIQNIQGRLGEMDRINRQIGSGDRLTKPADDPAGANRLVRIEEVVARNEQYLKNIEEAISVQRTTESVLEQVYQRLVRAKGLALEGANDASEATTGTFAALAEEVGGIRDGVLQLALTKYQDEYLFAGTAGSVAPFGDGGGAYRGDGNFLRINMGNGQTVAVNVPGDRAFREGAAWSAAPLPATVDLAGDLSFSASDGTTSVTVTVPAGSYPSDQVAAMIDDQLQASGANLGARLESDGSLAIAIANSSDGGELTLDDPSGALESALGIAPGTRNLFGMLHDLEQALLSEEPARVGALLGRLDRALDTLGSERGRLGSRSRNLEFARDRILNQNLTNETLRAEIGGVDLPEAVTRLSAEEQAYQTALAAGARIFNVSILDFLR